MKRRNLEFQGRKRSECLPSDSVRLDLVMQDIERGTKRETWEGGQGQILGGFPCHPVEVTLQEIIGELAAGVKQESLGLDISLQIPHPQEKGNWNSVPHSGNVLLLQVT